MKKTIALLLISIAFLAGCAQQANQQSDSMPNSDSTGKDSMQDSVTQPTSDELAVYDSELVELESLLTDSQAELDSINLNEDFNDFDSVFK
ncbi:MAG: hypothetical protein COV47_00460 [Candidatus Diapherotrites archaeon CG11_big_fil_rev_8_21_14_0_20_37_9]|nr:MAG: hypothetical protein COV47_00460 [Candidatus Diapherotrites archaeon CG11_big_fil_rev_8_21_14_0_20_37_9]